VHVLSSIADRAAGGRDLNGVAGVIGNGKRTTSTMLPGRGNSLRRNVRHDAISDVWKEGLSEVRVRGVVEKIRRG